MAKRQDSPLLIEMAEKLGGLVERVSDLAADITEVKALQKTQNGNVAHNTQAVALVRAGLETHERSHADTKANKTEGRRLDVETLKAVGPLVSSLLSAVVLVLWLLGVAPAGAAKALDVPVPEASPHPAPVVAPTATATPRPSPSPKATDEPKAGDEDRAALSRLCWVEARGAGKAKADACLSVISTVLVRADEKLFSDGSVRGTLVYDCHEGDMECHFPAYSATAGCDGLLLAYCPDNSPSELAYFAAVVDAFFDGGMRGSCQHYLYYGSRPIDRPECVVGGLRFFERMK